MRLHGTHRTRIVLAALLAASAVVASHGRDDNDVAVAGDTVPFTYIPVPPNHQEPSPPGPLLAGPDVVDCTAEGLRLRVEKFDFDEIKSGRFARLTLAARSSDCALADLQGVRLIGRQGDSILVPRTLAVDPPARRLLVTESEPAVTQIWWRCSPVLRSGLSAVEVELPGGQRLRQALDADAPECLPGELEVPLPITVDLLSVEPPRLPIHQLKAALRDVPKTVRVGQPLRFTVELTNPTATEVLFDPCPAWQAWLSGRKWHSTTYTLLNCSQKPSLAAGERVRFAVEVPTSPDRFTVATDDPPRPKSFVGWSLDVSWSLNGYVQAKSGHPVMIVGR